MNKFLIAFILSLLPFVVQANPVLWACRNQGVTLYLEVNSDSSKFTLFNDKGQHIATNNLEIIKIGDKEFFMSAIAFRGINNEALEIMISISIEYHAEKGKILILELKGSGDENNPIFALGCV